MKKIKENTYLINIHKWNKDIVAVHGLFVGPIVVILYTSLEYIWLNLT